MTDNLLLTARALELELAPRIGGGIARFDHAGAGGRTPCLRGAEAGTSGVLDHGCFPLVPFSNRIRGGRFVFRGREVTLAPNMAGDPSPLHGQGWLAPWEVVSAGPAAAELVFRHEAGEWPWAYEARQLFALDPDGLTATLSCRNLSDTPMPCGLGHHPYFPCAPSTRLDTGVDCAWTIDENVLPIDKVPAEGRYDLRDRAICGQGLDNGFGGWSGIARIEAPGATFRIDLSSPDARFFQVYSPKAGGLFVAEPVTHANAALNAPEAEWPELGLRVLAPG
jgi:aldose 1-epimerase